MRRFLLWALAIVWTQSSSAKPLSTEEQSKFLNSMRNALKDVKALEIDVQQIRVMHLLANDLKSSAKLYIDMPDKVRWETIEPFQSAIIYNSGQAAKYEKTDGAWRKINFSGTELLAEIMKNIMTWNQGDFSSTKDIYQIVVHDDARIDLIPNDQKKRAFLDKIELFSDKRDYKVKRVILREAKGDYVELKFTKQMLNPKLDPKLFAL